MRHLLPALRFPPSIVKMSISTFTIPRDLDRDVSPPLHISCVAELSREDLLRFPAFRVWLTTLQRSLSRQQHPSHEFSKDPYVLRKIDIQAVDYFAGGRLGFLKLKAEVSNGNGETLPGSVFLRGGSVGMLVIDLSLFASSRHYLNTILTNAPLYSSYFNQTMFLIRRKRRNVRF